MQARGVMLVDDESTGPAHHGDSTMTATMASIIQQPSGTGSQGHMDPLI